MTISLSRGALILAKKQVVPRRLSAIEDLGSIDILCTDKTGTITENKLAVSSIFGNEDEVMRYALMVPRSLPDATSVQNSVFDVALLKRAESSVGIVDVPRRIDELPFDPIRRRDSVLVNIGGKHLLVMRGSPENVYATAGVPIDEKTEEWIKEEGKKGCRVIAIAYNEVADWITRINDETEQGVHVVGLVSFADPLKASTREAVTEAKRLGIQIKVITGDAREVASWVGFEAGILTDRNEVITGDELDRMTPAEKLVAVERYNIFARTMPLQKTEIILLLQKNHLVGFLGEGFNDAPALKAAHVGLAVANASDIAQDAADVVLLNPSLMVIIDGVKEGRKIFANSMKYLRATLASNFGNFYALALSSLFIPYLPMLPIQVLLLNLLSDFPMMTIATDNVDDKELERPRGYKVAEVTSVAVVLGVVSTIFDFAFFGYFQQFGESVLQTMWFAGSIITELVIVFSIRTTLPFWKARRPARALTLLSLFVMVLTVALLYIPKVQEVFHFVAPSMKYMIPAAVLIGAYFITTEAVKLMFYRLWKDKDSEGAGLVAVR
jgi:Mg2+-importing ATPase